MPAGFSAFNSPTVPYVVIEVTSSPYAPSTTPINSNVVAMSVTKPDGTVLTATGLSNKIEVALVLSKDTPSPICMSWDGTTWKQLPSALQRLTNCIGFPNCTQMSKVPVSAG